MRKHEPPWKWPLIVGGMVIVIQLLFRYVL